MALLFPDPESDSPGSDERYLNDPRYQTVREFIISREGFTDTPHYDVNEWRAGYGSDTITDEDGTIRRVTQHMVYPRDAANRDFDRRLTTEFIPKVKRAIGEETFDSLDPNTLAVLTSLAYNYGNLTADGLKRRYGDNESVLEAAQSGNRENIAQAIERLAPTQEIQELGLGPGFLSRRAIEADFVRAWSPDEEVSAVTAFTEAPEDDGFEGVPYALPENIKGRQDLDVLSGLLAMNPKGMYGGPQLIPMDNQLQAGPSLIPIPGFGPPSLDRSVIGRTRKMKGLLADQ